MKKVFRIILNKLNLNITENLIPGFGIHIKVIHRDKCSTEHEVRAHDAMQHVLSFEPESLLDVGYGEGLHSKFFNSHGIKVTAVDYGESIYVKKSRLSKEDGINLIVEDFNQLEMDEEFDVVWASHILEHQPNVQTFLSNVIKCSRAGGLVCLTLPLPHRHLWGGHLTLWSPGLLCYNIVLCGLDLSDCFFVRGYKEFSIFFFNRKIALPSLSFDNGDIDLLGKFMPNELHEGSDPWKVKYKNV